jgi:hypothetical protein
LVEPLLMGNCDWLLWLTVANNMISSFIRFALRGETRVPLRNSTPENLFTDKHRATAVFYLLPFGFIAHIQSRVTQWHFSQVMDWLHIEQLSHKSVSPIDVIAI